MSLTLNRAAYQRLVDEDLVWLRAQPRSLERDHIEQIVKYSVVALYDEGLAFKEPDRA